MSIAEFARMPKKALPLEAVEIAALDASQPTVFNTFSSGQPSIDRWLKNNARKCVKRLETRVFLASASGETSPLGYYALRVSDDLVGDGIKSHNSYVKTRTSFQGIHLAYLGVHEDFQGQGLGKYLMMDAIDRVAQVSEHVGFYAFTLTAIDQATSKFYSSLGFETYSEDRGQFKMLMPVETVRELRFTY